MISKRLMTCAKLIKGFDYLLDVGSDHAFLPIYVIKNNYTNRALATDVNQGPIDNAIKNIYEAKLPIETMIYDGIPLCNADILNISGMGGELIIKILDNGLHNLSNLKRVVLAPNSDCDLVRKYMCEKDFYITDEMIVKDGKHYYEIMAFEKGQAIYSDDDYKFGPLLRKEKNVCYLEKYQKSLFCFKEILKSVVDLKKKNEIQEKIDSIERNI